MKPYLILSAFVVLAPLARSQSSLGTTSIVGTTNISQPQGGFIYSLERVDGNGAPTHASFTRSFTGLDRAQNTQTMTFSGDVTNSAQYGQLRTNASGRVVNSYYNPDNLFFANASTGEVNENGSPEALVSIGFSSFDDTLQFGGILQAGYKARYVFHVDGINSGVGFFCGLAVDIDTDIHESFFALNEGFNQATWATQSYEINGVTPQSLHVQFSSQFVLNTEEVADGGTYEGASNFSSTLTLAAIEMRDANDNLVDGWTVTAASGTQYTQGVPEPATFLILGSLLPVFLKRRRQKA